jgi:tyrosyl-tRNA synthetase
MEKIDEILSRGVTEVVVKDQLKKDLKSGKKLRIKLGIDPTGAKVHIGHAVAIWKLKQFQDLGHKIVLIIGDFTAQIGDPSDKTAERQPLTADEIRSNMKTYLDQIGKILDLKKTEIHHNSDWHASGSKQDLVLEASNFTVNQMIKRENFWQRFEADKPIGLQEILYPLFQGYDSVAVKADVEVGGNDQLFNLLAGRTLQKRYGQKEQNIITFELLFGTDGRKMSKTYDNAIYIEDEPNEMFGKAMSINDDLIVQYLTVATDLPLDKVTAIEKDLKEGKNPRDAKVILAKTLVKRYFGEKKAEEAHLNFENVFVKNDLPDEMPEVKVLDKKWPLADLMQFSGLVSSKSEGRRMIDQGGVKVDGALIGEREAEIRPVEDMIIQVGKRKFVRIKLDK